MLRRGIPVPAFYLLLAAAFCAFAQMVVTPAAVSPDARPWVTLSDASPATLRIAGHIEELQAVGAGATAIATTTTTTTTSTVSPTTTTTTTAPSAPPVPAPSPTAGTPARGRATATGCDAALAYLRAYAAPGFQLECPAYAEGHQGMTCLNESVCPHAAIIAIAVACPQSYMNEASNSWVLIGQSDAPIDPYGACP